MTPIVRSSWQRLGVPSLAAFAALVVLVSLGTWQVQRKTWKEALIRTIAQRLDAPPADLPPPATWPALDRADAEFRRVHLDAEFLNDQQALVYTNGSSLRSDANGPGYWVFAPARVQGSALLFVDRGYIPQGRQDLARDAKTPVTQIEIVGVLRWPDDRTIFSPGDDPDHNLWFVRDPVSMAAAKKLGPVAPFYVEQEAPTPPDGLPSPARLGPNLPNNHLQYAITWYGLALVLVGVFATYIRVNWRG